jgi:hypothetical protein
MARPKTIYQLMVTLAQVEPPIWRRVQVAGGVTLGTLHEVLQHAFGWHNAHLHEFTVDGRRFGTVDPEEPDRELADENEVALVEVAGERSRLAYLYDFGDEWEHEIVVEQLLAAEPGARYPRCVDGMRAAPPEDCGGPRRYADLLRALKTPRRGDAELLEWVGPGFDPERLDLVAINTALHARRSRSRRSAIRPTRVLH